MIILNNINQNKEKNIIEFINVGKKYPNGNTAVKNMSFEIKKGEFIVFIGTSGSGKTTALKMINRLEDATDGSIRIKGKDINEYNLYRMRCEMGYVLQEVALFPHMSVERNIGIVPELKGMKKDEISSKTDELLEIMGLDSRKYRKRMPGELSGGEAQRVGIARALAGNPEIVLMDEPFSALDPITRKNLQEDIRQLQKKICKTVVFVTHDIEEAFFLADRIFLMKDGEIVQAGTKEELVERPENQFVRDFVKQKKMDGERESGRKNEKQDCGNDAEAELDRKVIRKLKESGEYGKIVQELNGSGSDINE